MTSTNHPHGEQGNEAPAPGGGHRISIEATDGHQHHFDSDMLDARYAAQRLDDSSIEVTIQISDRAGVLKEFVVRRFAHNEAHDIHES